jgi:hypothetical protein
MKKLNLYLGASLVALMTACGSDAPTDIVTDTDTVDSLAVLAISQASDFSIDLAIDGTDHSNAPALQSFVYGEGSGGDMLLIGGRINGFHGFIEPDESFPYDKANTNMYVYNRLNDTVWSMPVSTLSKQLAYMFASTNMQHVREGKYLYMNGGYVQLDGTDEWTTLNLFVRVDVSRMIGAIKAQDTTALNASIVWTWNKKLEITGGELFKLSDGNFYLCVGHNFQGMYTHDAASVSQVYQDKVTVFQVDESVKDTITIIESSFQYLSDNLPDSITQYRRRDLNVVPSVEYGGNSIGLTMYAGVFTSPVAPTKAEQNKPFKFPIYIGTGGGTPSAAVDETYTQETNVYAAANVLMYDDAGVMYTTVIGGIGDELNNDDFTKKVLTLRRDYTTSVQAGVTTASYQPDLANYNGSEAVFIIDPAPGVEMYMNSTEIFDYISIPSGTTRLGYMYGGIQADSAASSPTKATYAINTFYEVTITKN